MKLINIKNELNCFVQIKNTETIIVGWSMGICQFNQNSFKLVSRYIRLKYYLYEQCVINGVLYETLIGEIPTSIFVKFSKVSVTKNLAFRTYMIYDKNMKYLYNDYYTSNILKRGFMIKSSKTKIL